MSKQRVQFDDLFTYTRNSIATYREPVTGLITGVGIDAPRFEANGLLIEPAATNLIEYSEYDNDDYAPSVNTTQATMQFRAGVVSKALFFDATAEVKNAYRTYAGHSLGQTYTLSCIIEMRDGLGAPVFSGAYDAATRPFSFLFAGEPMADPITVEHLQGNFYRVSQTSTLVDSFNNFGVLRVSTNQIRTFKVSGFQLELSGAVTSYIPTAGAAESRAADAISRTLDTEYSEAEGTFYMEFDPGAYTGLNINVMGTLLGYELARRTGADSYAASNYDFDYAYPAAAKTGALEKLAISIDPAGLWILARNGQSVTYNAGRFDAFGSDMLQVSSISLMDGGRGRVAVFRYWPRALTGEEMIAEMAL